MLTIYSIIMSTVWSSLMILIIFGIRRHPALVIRYNITPLTILLIGCVLRLVLPLEFPGFTEPIYSKSLFVSFNTVMYSPLFEVGEAGVSVLAVHHPLDDSLQGLILPELSSGVFGFDPQDRSEPNLLAALGCESLSTTREELSAARKTFARARVFHNDQEKIYIRAMDFDAADLVTQETIARLIPEAGTGEPGSAVHRYFGAATADGNLDHIPQVTEDIPHRYYIKGRPGTGKSTFLKKIAKAAEEKGWPVEVYHCSLDPNSLDLIAVRPLGFCLLDSTAPHEYFPSREGDEIIDLYQACVAPGTDERNAGELARLNAAYKALVKEAVGHLKAAKDAMERFNAALPPLDPCELEAVKSGLLEKLF